MHDPMTVAFEIRRPWPKKPQSESARARDKKFYSRRFWLDGYLPPLVTIWHVDPEKDGSDDSCGWFAPRLTKGQLKAMRDIAGDEARDPWFLAADEERISDPARANALLDGALALVSLVLGFDPYDRKMMALRENLRNRLLHNSFDNIRSMLCYKPFYHGNDSDHEYWREENAVSLFSSLARNILREKRPWCRHPRWHIHHWKIQIHPIQAFKRWAFSSCEVCGEGFSWGYAPVSRNWYGGGPRWFRGEGNVRHHECDAQGRLATRRSA